MKKQHIKRIIDCIFIVLLVITIGLIFVYIFKQFQKPTTDDIFGNSGDIAISMIFFIPIVIAEIELYSDIVYFGFKKKENYKTIISIIALVAMLGAILSVISMYVHVQKINGIIFMASSFIYCLTRMIYGLMILAKTSG